MQEPKPLSIPSGQENWERRCWDNLWLWMQFLSNQNKQILSKLEKMMATLNDLQAAVTAEDTVVDSAITLLQGLAAQVAALQPNQAAIDALAADITAKTQTLADAVAQNTPASP